MDAEAVFALPGRPPFRPQRTRSHSLTGDVEFVCENRRIARAMSMMARRCTSILFEYTVDAVNPRPRVPWFRVNFSSATISAAPSESRADAGRPRVVRRDEHLLAPVRRQRRRSAPGHPVPWPGIRIRPSTASAESCAGRIRFFRFGRASVEDSYLQDPQCNFWESVPLSFSAWELSGRGAVTRRHGERVSTSPRDNDRCIVGVWPLRCQFCCGAAWCWMAPIRRSRRKREAMLATTAERQRARR